MIGYVLLIRSTKIKKEKLFHTWLAGVNCKISTIFMESSVTKKIKSKKKKIKSPKNVNKL